MTTSQTATNADLSANSQRERDSPTTRRAPMLLKHTSLLCVVGSGLLLLAACGGDSSPMPTAPSAAQAPPPIAAPTPPPPPPPPTPVTTVIGLGSHGVPSGFGLPVTFTTTATGTVGATVDWTFATSDIDIFLVRGTLPCSVEQFNNDQCPFLGFSVSTSAKPERLSVPNLAAGPYTLYIVNFGSSDESLSYEITLTNVPGAAASSMRGSTFGGIKGSIRGIGNVD